MLVAISLVAGAALLIIGARLLLVPQSAARFFGIAPPSASFELHYVVALRDLWLAILVIGLAVWKAWRGLALWFGLGALVCLGDGSITAASSGRLGAILFHTSAGVFCALLAAACLLEARRSGP